MITFVLTQQDNYLVHCIKRINRLIGVNQLVAIIDQVDNMWLSLMPN